MEPIANVEHCIDEAKVCVGTGHVGSSEEEGVISTQIVPNRTRPKQLVITILQRLRQRKRPAQGGPFGVMQAGHGLEAPLRVLR